MNYLHYKQLAFILDIDPIKALEKIIAIHCKIKGIQIPYPQKKITDYLHGRDKKGKKIRNSLPESMEIDTLSGHLGIQTLRTAIQDIKENYLVRPATRKWILCDYPEKLIKAALAAGKKKTTLSLPGALKSLLSDQVAAAIAKEWAERFPKAIIKP
jgi:hypothetical protein